MDEGLLGLGCARERERATCGLASDDVHHTRTELSAYSAITLFSCMWLDGVWCRDTHAATHALHGALR